MSPEEAPFPLFDRIVGNVERELGAQNAMRDLGLSSELIAELAADVAVNLDYAFRFRWQPRWVRPGDPHQWREPTGDENAPWSYFAECVSCGWVTAERSEEVASEHYWEHRFSVHGGAAEESGFCCAAMRSHVEQECDEHPDPFECPDTAMIRTRESGVFGSPSTTAANRSSPSTSARGVDRI